MKAGWEEASMGDLCALVRGPFGGSLKKAIFKPSGYAVYEQQHAIRDQFEDFRYFVDQAKFEEMARFSVNPGDIIMSCSGTMGKVAKVPESAPVGIINQALLKISPLGKIYPDFLMLWMESPGFQDQLSSTTMGVAIKNVASVKTLKGMPIPLPPLEEQQRIVAVLDEAFEGLARARGHAEANLQNARELFDRAVFELFENLRIEHPTLELSEMAEKITKGSSPKWQGISYVDEPGVLFVTSENVGKNEIDLAKTKYVEKAFNEKDRKSILAKGDVLTNIVGASIGRTAVFELDDVANINQAVCLIRCDSKRLNNYFLSYLLNSPYFKAQLHAGEVNMARANLSLTFFRELKVPVPPVDMQEEVVQEVDALRLKTETLEKDYQSKLQDLDDLRQSLLQKAFAGELT
ncbi:restriction endonuclease subunit S [Marivita sp. S0852]|uniref:restriction endonuclease subunit S n=1 Tax=Marivita sp. S0852 TaxID=3373893 RepID=UPI003981ABEE